MWMGTPWVARQGGGNNTNRGTEVYSSLVHAEQWERAASTSFSVQTCYQKAACPDCDSPSAHLG